MIVCWGAKAIHEHDVLHESLYNDVLILAMSVGASRPLIGVSHHESTRCKSFRMRASGAVVPWKFHKCRGLVHALATALRAPLHGRNVKARHVRGKGATREVADEIIPQSVGRGQSP